MNKRAVIYARVSTEEQGTTGYSLPSQIEACQKYAALHGLTVVNEFSEEYSGMKLDRPKLDQLRILIDERQVEVVIVLSSDRLTRNIAHLLILREQFQAAGVELHYCARGKSASDTPEGRMTENIEAVFNEYWREKIVESSRRGMNRKAREGKVVGVGKVTYGYRYADGQLTIYEPEAAIVRQVFQWYVVGDETGKTLPILKIAERLSVQKVPTPRYGQGWRKVKPGVWPKNTIARFIKNETYAGVWYWGKTVGQNGSLGCRPKSEQIAVSVPAIIDRTVWETAQAQCAHNSAMALRNTKREYLLRGLVRCGCGKPMRGLSKQRKHHLDQYYRCQSVQDTYRALKNRDCEMGAVGCKNVDTAVWEAVLKIILSDTVDFENALRLAQEAETAAQQPTRNRLTTIANLLAECEAEADKIARAIRNAGKGIVGAALQRQHQALEAQYAALVEEQSRLQKTLDTVHLTESHLIAALQFREDVLLGMINPTFADKRRVLELLQVRVVIHDKERATFSCLIPVSEQTPVELHIPTNYCSPPRSPRPRAGNA